MNLADIQAMKALSLAKEGTNPTHNQGGIVFGQEYLSSFHKKIMSWSTSGTTMFNVVFSGDSTTHGDSTSSTTFHIDQIIKDMALKNGFPQMNVVNNGQSGKDTEHWNQTYVQTDLSANPDLLVLRWGINDPYYAHLDNSNLGDSSSDNPTLDMQRRTASDFETSLRNGLTTIRASKPQNQLSIILMAPNSVSDDYNGRNEKWIQSIIPAIEKAARDFQCCFINTYQLIQDSRNANDYMDSPYSDFRHIHPNDVMNLWITSVLFDAIFPKGLIGKFAMNNVVNNWSGNVTKLVTDPPSSYPYGFSINRVANAPFDGIFITFRASDEVVLQINSGYDVTKNSYAVRIGRPVVTNTWSTWNNNTLMLEDVTQPTLTGGWVNYDATNGRLAGYYKDPFGIVHLQGLIKSGTATPGTALFTLSTGYRPSKACYFPVSSNNAFGSVSVDITGVVAIQAGSNTWLSLDGITFRP